MDSQGQEGGIVVKHSSTPYPDVNEVLHLVLTETHEVLGKQFMGLYLYGSLSSGDFHPNASDIDYLVVTQDILPENIIVQLEDMHNRIWAIGNKWTERLECSYIPKKHLSRYEKTDVEYPTVNEHKFYLAPHGSDWIIQRHIIREHGIALTGPDPKTLIEPVAPDDIRRAVRGILQEWWFPMLDDPSWLRTHGSEYHAFAVLTMCRALHALEHGTIVSKPVAAKWAQRKLREKWTPVIENSLATRLGARDFELYNDAIDLIRYTMEYVNTNLTMDK